MSFTILHNIFLHLHLNQITNSRTDVLLWNKEAIATRVDVDSDLCVWHTRLHLCCRSPGGWWRWSASGRSLCSSACSQPLVSSSPALWSSHTRPHCALSAWTGPGRTLHALDAPSAENHIPRIQKHWVVFQKVLVINTASFKKVELLLLPKKHPCHYSSI